MALSFLLAAPATPQTWLTRLSRPAGMAFSSGNRSGVSTPGFRWLPRPKSMQRVLRYDGLLPYLPGAELTPAVLPEIKAYIDANRPLDTPFDIVVEGVTPGDDPSQAAAIVGPWIEAGATWWIEALWPQPGQPQALQTVRQRVLQGPPAQ